MNFLKRLVGGDNDIPHLELVNPHTHEWELLSKTFGEPRHDSVAAFSQDSDAVDRALFGVTTLLFTCVVCKDFRKETVIGTDTPTLIELVDKINIYGPQYYQRDGVTYVIQRYQAQRIDPSTNLPLR